MLSISHNKLHISFMVISVGLGQSYVEIIMKDRTKSTGTNLKPSIRKRVRCTMHGMYDDFYVPWIFISMFSRNLTGNEVHNINCRIFLSEAYTCICFSKYSSTMKSSRLLDCWDPLSRKSRTSSFDTLHIIYISLKRGDLMNGAQ